MYMPISRSKKTKNRVDSSWLNPRAKCHFIFNTNMLIVPISVKMSLKDPSAKYLCSKNHMGGTIFASNGRSTRT